jgi:hypothetical protein
VLVANHPQGDKIPREVILTLKYFQVSQREKKLIKAWVGFQKYIKASPKELSGESLIKYNISFNYIPMTHTELIVSFAFSWEIYLLLYLGIGFFASIIVLIFHIYHMIFFRYYFKVLHRIK